MPSTSSTSNTAPSKVGKCVVCAKETTLKCGECAKQRLDFYFCSIDHKRKIWFTHKRVCGSTPFRFPGFSPIEFRALVNSLPDEHAANPEMRPWKADCPCKGCGGGDAVDLSRQQMETEYAYLQDVSKDKQGQPWKPKELSTLVMIRSEMYLARASFVVKSGSGLIDAQTLIDTAFDYFANRIRTALPKLFETPNDYPFYSTLLHKYLFYVSTKVLHHTAVTNSASSAVTGESIQHHLTTTNELEQFIRKVVAKTHPKEAELLLKDLRDSKDIR